MTTSRKLLRPEVLGKIARLELRARAVVEGFVNGLHTSPYHGLAVEFAEHREYAPGDDVRHIDWRLYAKSDRYYIKQYEEETNLRCHILLDCSASMTYPEQPEAERMTKWDYAATVAASMAFLQIHQQDAVGLLMFDDQVRDQLSPASSRRQIGSIINAIESQAPANKTDVGSLFRHLADHIRRRSMVVVVSDLLAPYDEVVAGLGRLRHTGHEVIVLHVMDHDELEFPFTRQTLFEGLELDAKLRTDPQALRRTYLDAVRRFTQRLKSFCIDNRIDYTLLSTTDPLDVAMPALLASRMHAIRAMMR